METLKINRNELKDGMCGIEHMIEDLLKSDFNAKNVRVVCKTRNWQGHTCPEFTATVDGVKLLVFGDIDPMDLEIDPWVYDMKIDYFFKD